MATRNIVPRATGEGQIGTSAKTWSAGYFNDIAVTNGVTASTFTGDLTGDVTGNADTATNATNATNDGNGNAIASTYLPKAGGTMTGNLNFEADISINASADNQSIGINGGTAWDKGAWMSLWGKDHATYPGYFGLHASNGTNDYGFVGKPNGDLTWDGERVAVQGGLVNGHGILTGHKGNISVPANSYVQGTISFGQTFASAPRVVVCSGAGHAHVSASINNANTTATSFTYTVSNETGSSFTNEVVMWIAIG